VSDQLLITIDGDAITVDVVAWDRVAAERMLAAAGRPLMKHPLEMAMAMGYYALMRHWHGAKTEDYEPYTDILQRADIEEVGAGVDPTEAARLLGGA
jgi:hypothetical protein